MKALLTIVTLLLPLAGMAQSRTIALWGHVRDQFTKAGIPGTKITLMTSDSTVVDTMSVTKSWYGHNGANADTYYRFEVQAKAERYIIKAEHPDYEDTYVHFNLRRVARNTYFDAPFHYMKRRDKPVSSMDKTLGEVTVKATRVQLYYRGDTIVFNADAFNVPEGSMLDAIIRQLPGVELKDGGEIFVNGRKVENLTLNGKDFFRGNNQIMLDNLPYYTVKQIRVFDADTERNKYMGRQVDQKELTMDVVLKREYSTGYMANATAGMGTDDTYLGRIFGLRYSDNSRLTLFGNINNVNEYAMADGNGNWSTNQQSGGQLRFVNAGAEWAVNDKDSRMTNNMTANVHCAHNNLERRTTNENYLATGNTWGRSDNTNKADEMTAMFANAFTLKLPVQLNSYVNGYYYRSTSDSRSASLTAADVLLADTVNSTSNRNRGKSYSISLSTDNHANFKIGNGDMLMLTVNASYHKKQSKAFGHEAFSYRQRPADNRFHNRYNTSPARDYELYAELAYELHFRNDLNLRFYASAQYNENSTDNNQHRLDLLGNLWDMETGGHALGELPQSRDSLLMALDVDNAYWRTQREESNKAGVYIYHNHNKNGHNLHTSFGSPVHYRYRWLDYRSAPLTRTLKRHWWYFEPQCQLRFYKDQYQKQLTFNAGRSVQTPDMMNLLDRRDDSNPLNVFTGNPHLKPSINYYTNYHVGLRRNRNDRNLWLDGGTTVTQDAIGNGYDYNPVTGARTFHPLNVNGNWQWHNTMGFGIALDSLKRWHIDLRTGHTFSRTKDLASVGGTMAGGFSTVRNHVVSGELRLRYNKGRLSYSAFGNVSHRRILRQTDNDNNSLTEFSYGANGTFRLPWQLSLATDLRVACRRGYKDTYMNTNDVLWDTSLSRTFLKNALTVKVNAHDILGQISNVRYIVNAQGRTETWTNTITRYVMLSVAYKFSKNPKKKQ